uniref:Uncharacterized protein n=1 Tax=uncultured Thiotrichaceae bacterium TaxID=298394 RepID=A0A6S6SXP8_9GAMM|nr:MAG: Unknown protein [uncultured Thiotrichaceae bacterium]
MKKFITLSSLSALLCACSTIPVPVSPGLAIPNILPRNPVIAYVPQADPFLVQQPNIEAARPVARTQPAVAVSAMPAAYSPATAIPAATSAISVHKAPVIPKTIAPVNATTTIQNSHQLQNLNWLSGRILKNQTGDNPKKLISWNEKGNFVALGIGHFIWYPTNKKGQYNESFPAFLNYAKSHGAQLPSWLANQYKEGAPWSNSATFSHAQNDPQLRELHVFMNKTLNLQANFMTSRLKQTVPAMIRSLPPQERQRVQNNYQVVERSPGGIYPLLDYIQFKGSGINPAERYQGKGWGLLQVLRGMQTVQPGAAALAEFRRSADDVLVRRIANAPATSREAQHLSEWLDRISTYNPKRS